MNGIKKWIIVLNVCLIMMITTGCWNNMDITEMAYIVAMGLDRTDDNKIELTLQIVKASVIKAAAKGSSEEKAIWTISTTGDTLLEAFRHQLAKGNRRLPGSHIQLIVIQDKLAREGIIDILDPIIREHSMNRKVNLLISKDITAKEILQAESELTKIPSMHIAEILKNNTVTARIKNTEVMDIIKEIIKPGKNPVIGMIEEVKKSKKMLVRNLNVEGSAVFKKDKLVGFLNPIETRGLLFIEDKVKLDTINVPNPLDKNKKVTIEITRSKTKKKVELINGKITLLIEVKEEGNLREQQGSGNLVTEEMIKILEEETEKIIEKEIRDVVELAQKEFKSDILGFGEEVYKKHLDIWKRLEYDWDEVFCNLPVKIKVKSNIRRTGIIKEQLTPK